MAKVMKSRNLNDVEEGCEFRCNDGKTFKNLKELMKGLKKMNKDTFEHHVNERNDFSNWIRDCIGLKKLADSIEKCKTRTCVMNEIRKVM